MDWCAKLLGLDEKFHTSSGIGGGVLQVSIVSEIIHDAYLMV